MPYTASALLPVSFHSAGRGALSLFVLLALGAGLGGCARSISSPAAAPVSRPRAYVTNNMEGTVSTIDVETGSEIAAVKIPNVGSRRPYPAFVTAAPDGSKIYVANLNTNSLSVIDTATNAISRNIALDHPPRGMAMTPDGRKLYVAGDGEVAYVVDTETDRLVASIPLGEASFQTAVAPDGRHAYATTAEGSLAVIDVASDTMVSSIADLRSAGGLAIDRSGDEAYVLRNAAPGRVYVVDLASRSVVAEIWVDSNPIAAALSPDGRWLYVVNRGSDSLSVIDTQTRQVAMTLPAGSVPSGIAVSRDGKLVFVTAMGSNTIYVLSPETRSVARKIHLERQVPPRPMGLVLIGD